MDSAHETKLTWSPAKSTNADVFLSAIKSRPELSRTTSRATCAVVYSHARIDTPRQ
jgi:hypothetical protein